MPDFLDRAPVLDDYRYNGCRVASGSTRDGNPAGFPFDRNNLCERTDGGESGFGDVAGYIESGCAVGTGKRIGAVECDESAVVDDTDQGGRAFRLP